MTIITDSDELAAFCKELAQEEFITIDTEFLREKTYYPKLCLIQLSSPDKTACAVDPLAKGIDISPLFDLLQNKAVLKVFHAARQDLEIFYNLMGCVATPIFDTQVAAMACGYGDSISYEKLVNNIASIQIDKSSQFTDWSIRPLSNKQVKYALGDVTHLCDVYKNLHTKLKKKDRCSWVIMEEEILNNPDTYKNDPYKAWERIKIRSPRSRSLAVLRELAALREQQAQKRNIPKNWVIRDDTLADMANQVPHDKKQLMKIRNISKDVVDGRFGDLILKAIEAALTSPKETWPVPQKKTALSPNVIITIDILKMLLKIESTEHGVAAKIIASSEDIKAIALDDNALVPALKGWRREIFGEDALAVKHGLLAIAVKDGKITKIPVT
ncbi:MAG: ribonuclease D [Alphaproteobacteria bacterium]|nr:ribonuclease D [Alphaproteobacteria bacterium]